MISATESNKNENLNNILCNISTFIKFFSSNDRYLNLFTNITYFIKPYKYLKHINIIMNLIKNENIREIQLKYSYMIPPLLTREISEILNKYVIINKYIFSSLDIHRFIKSQLINKNIYPKLLDTSLEINEYIINNNDLLYYEKIYLLDYLKNMIDLNQLLSLDDLCENLKSFTKLSIDYLTKKKDFNSFDEIISSNRNNIKNILFELSSYTIVKTFDFNNYDIQIENIINNISVSNSEKNYLKQFSKLLHKYYDEFNIIKDYPKIGKKFGMEFRNFPTIENSAKLISIIIKGVEETMNISPYLIQCISVETFLFHYIDIKNRNNKKGRLAQIKTGEGKSLIIAILSLSNALMGYFVDVITSTKYLAKRDQIKFKKLFDLFEISSNNITRRNPEKYDYNGIILYGTNTDFEFSLLRENIFIQDKLFTKPLNSDILIKRKYEVAIVDECDNLFLDTALNSARIAHESNKISYNWVYQPIFEFVSKGNNNINSLRNILSKYENGIYKNIVDSIDDKKLMKWIKSAKIALQKQKNLDYIVAFNKDLQKHQVQIVSKDTGRVHIGTRWTSGIHEFVEVKENLIPENESNIIGSISHPTYFENYDFIFGLTGTIGETIEKNEIMTIYKMDSYYIPRNFGDKTIKLESEIFENQELKYKRIISLIQNLKIPFQPILIILPDINNTLEFSLKLKSLNINHMLLNDTQKENEDYILNNSGEINSILVATNAAGRGTDIILTEKAKQLGGLFVIFAFFPENSRIENQGLGRAGRQGNKGKSIILFSKDELFINILTNGNNHSNDIQSYIELRTKYVKFISEMRMKYIENERKFYSCLKMFFAFKLFLNNILKSDYCLNKLEEKNISGVNLNYYMKNVILYVEDSWSEFYSEIISDRENDIINGTIYFNQYLLYLNENWQKFCLKFYQEKKENTYEKALFCELLLNIIEKWFKIIDNRQQTQNFETFLKNFII